jgi:hypothetical protein
MAHEDNGTNVKKEKKHKKADHTEDSQYTVSESGSLSPQEVAPGDFRKAKKEKKEKKAKRDRLDESIPEMASQTHDRSPSKKEKKSKKHKLECDDECILPETSCLDDNEVKVKKSKKEKKEKKDKSESLDCITPESFFSPDRRSGSMNVAIETPTGSQPEWAENWEEASGSKYWKRIDEDKWKNQVAGTKFSRISHYDKGGDAWGNQAAEALGKVKGKGFIKVMQKMKRASWKGEGKIDTGVNSVQFSDWED